MNATVITVQAVLSGEPRNGDEADRIADRLLVAVESDPDTDRAVVAGIGVASVAPAPADITNEPVANEDEG